MIYRRKGIDLVVFIRLLRQIESWDGKDWGLRFTTKLTGFSF